MHITTTRRWVLLFASSFLALFTRGGGSQNTGAEQETAAVLNNHMNWMGDAFVPAAEAMPEDKFFWVPTHGEFRGVRSFAEQLLHVAEVNFLLSAAILAEKPPVMAAFAEHKPEIMQTRTAVLKYLTESFAYTHKALSSITEQNARLPIKHPIFDMITTRLGLGIVAIAHPFNHYGQLVEYLRMNNIIPPASRQ